MADETADVLNNEQLVICIRWVDEDLEVNKEFLGVDPIEITKAETIFTILKVRTITWIFQCNLLLILMPHDHVHMFKFILMFQLMLSFQLLINIIHLAAFQFINASLVPFIMKRLFL